MSYLIVGWKEDKIDRWFWYLSFFQATSEYSRLINSREFAKVSFYKVDLNVPNITLLGEE